MSGLVAGLAALECGIESSWPIGRVRISVGSKIEKKQFTALPTAEILCCRQHDALCLGSAASNRRSQF